MKHAFTETINAGMLDDGKRMCLRHGPIELIIEADGRSEQVAKAYQQALTAFESVLTDLVEELSSLRKPVTQAIPLLRGEIASNMYSVTKSVTTSFFATPMIAVAGAVADHILAAMVKDTQLKRAYVNNGGDIALFLDQGAHFDIGICADIKTGRILSKTRISAGDNIGGVATSGWQGRSHSLGIADAVTVLANNATTADAAATLIANAIDVPGLACIKRIAAHELNPDSDLADQLVTVDVGKLSAHDIRYALDRGKRVAESLINDGHIQAVHANLQGALLSLCVGMAKSADLTLQSELLGKEVSVA